MKGGSSRFSFPCARWLAALDTPNCSSSSSVSSSSSTAAQCSFCSKKPYYVLPLKKCKSVPKPLASGGSARFRQKQNEVVSTPAARCKCLRCFLYGNWGCPQPVGTSPPGPRSTPGRASASAQVPPQASTRSPRRKARTHAHTRGPSFQMHPPWRPCGFDRRCTTERASPTTTWPAHRRS